MSTYSTLLKTIKPAVGKIYFQGQVTETIFDTCIAVVGSRRMTAYGERVIEKIIPPLVNAGVTIVSGYMYGVDQKAHQTALECGGQSIAVLGWGIDFQKPVKNLVFMSEYPGKTKAQLWMFPRRNRIVAGLSLGVVVIEAANQSGSLITADFAIRYKRKLFAVPGPITSKMSEGTNSLIKNGLAQMVTDADDIFKIMGWKHKKEVKAENSSEIISLLQSEALTVDELAIKLYKTVTEVGVEISLLQLAGSIFEQNGKFYPKV